MPSVLQVFQSMLMLFSYLGMVLGASLGFDQIAREKDEGSLKFLVTSPVYRDAIVNGKTIGAIATLAGAMGAAFAIIVAVMLLRGVVPGAEDMIRIFLFFIASLLYCTVFFALAMMNLDALQKHRGRGHTDGRYGIRRLYFHGAGYASFLRDRRRPRRSCARGRL